jgi:ubiquinone/menaquinone biosynthesis C-methylase UbiE
MITRSIVGKSVLDVGCGRGYLVRELSKNYKVSGCDIFLDKDLKAGFRVARVEKLPYKDGEFDTVICSQVLEHVVDINQAIGELRRVAKKRLIVVVPKQRPYRYTLSLHLHFFPYKWSIESYFGHGGEIIDLGDWVYIEDR